MLNIHLETSVRLNEAKLAENNGITACLSYYPAHM